MRVEIEDLRTAYEKCLDGKIVFSERVDTDLVESLIKQAKSELEEAKEMEKLREGKAKNYSLMFCNRYDVMRKLIHALALFDKLKPSDHKCITAHLCLKHTEYELDWNTLETMRLLRNNVQYRGQGINQEIWMSHKPKFNIYIASLFSFVKKKLEN